MESGKGQFPKGQSRRSVVERHHWPRDQVPVFGKANWKDWLEVPVVIPVAVVQLEVVELIRAGRREVTHGVRVKTNGMNNRRNRRPFHS